MKITGGKNNTAFAAAQRRLSHCQDRAPFKTIMLDVNGAGAGEEGFVINKDGRELAIAGTEKGVLYGMYWLADRIESSRTETIVNGLQRDPEFKRRYFEACAPMYHHGKPLGEYGHWGWLEQMDSDYPPYIDETEFKKAVTRFKEFCRIMVAQGFNGLTIGDNIHLVTLDSMKVYPGNSSFRKRAEKYIGFFSEMINYAVSLKLDTVIYSDEIKCTPPVRKWIGRMCPANPRLWEFYQLKYKEIFERFPYISGAMLRYGESRSACGYEGFSIKNHRCSGCRNSLRAKRYSLLIEKTLETARYFGKEVMFRTWNPGKDNLHCDAEEYKSLFNKLPDSDLIVSMKNTATDFWFYQPPNPTIGLGKQEQIVELDCIRDYEGRGLSPCYIGEYSSQVFKMLKKKGVSGIWAWPSESGVPNGINGKPLLFTYFKGFTKWTEANVYLTARLAWNTEDNPKEILQDWAAKEYGKKASPVIANIIIDSEKASRSTFYIKGLAKNRLWCPMYPLWQHRVYCTYPPFWVWEAPEGNIFTLLHDIYNVCKDTLEREIEDGLKGLSLWKRMAARWKGIRVTVKDKRLYQDSMRSLQHGEAIAGVLVYYRESFLRYYDLVGYYCSQVLSKIEPGPYRRNDMVEYSLFKEKVAKTQIAFVRLKEAKKRYEDRFNVFDLKDLNFYLRLEEFLKRCFR